jgi:hypothetical protein
MGIMALSVFLGSLYLLESEGILSAMERPYLVPWVIATGVILVAPLVYLYRRDEFVLIHPLVLVTITYLFPVFFVGGWSLVFGWSNYYYLTYIENPEWNFQLTYIYIIIASACLSLGVLLPFGKSVGEKIGRFLPTWDFNLKELVVLGTVFAMVGLFLLLSAIDAGTSGYQALEYDSLREIGSFGTFLGITTPASLIFLWVAFFRLHGWGLARVSMLVFLIAVGLFVGVSSGAKAGLMSGFIGVLVAFCIARRKLNVRQWLLVGFASIALLFAGFTFASTFRASKGLERTSLGDYYGIAIDSIVSIQDRDLDSLFGEFVGAFFERIEIASSLAVVVSNHERLAIYEQTYGLENNIWQSTWLGFIPRFVWNDKPTIGDNRAFNQLYLDTEWSGFAITVIGDLLRNFGPIGVPLGMFVLGFVLRILHATLIESGNLESWKGVFYFSLMTTVSLEGFYGHILPGVIRVAAIVGSQIFLMRILVLLYRRMGTRSQ